MSLAFEVKTPDQLPIKYAFSHDASWYHTVAKISNSATNFNEIASILTGARTIGSSARDLTKVEPKKA